MPASRYFSYIRVSTQRQGQTGTSLTEQQAAIERYAQRYNLPIVRQFEEKETAAKLGRPVFLEMLKELRHGKASGVIIHKIDRSARNLKDWADLGNLIDSGLEVHFANETIDLNSRGGRLSADIQAVVASDYIRNLREEVKKGFYGRLKQGLLPMPAPVGYLDRGGGNLKTPDPVQAPLIKTAFELYGSGNWSMENLADELHHLGLRSRQGKEVRRNGLSLILRNPFYMGLIRLKRSGELFAGRHAPIIPKTLFDRVQSILEGKRTRKQQSHFFVFRRHIICAGADCGNKLIPETQKGFTYYRCQTKICPNTSLREDRIELDLIKFFEKIQFTSEENRIIGKLMSKLSNDSTKEIEANKRQLSLQLEQIKTRLSKLADAYVDEVFDRQTYLEKKNALITEEQEIKEKLIATNQDFDAVRQRIEAFLELVNSAYLSYQWGTPEEKRELVQTVTSNFVWEEKSVLFKLHFPFEVVMKRLECSSGGPQRATTRTLTSVIKRLFAYFRESSISKDVDEY